MYEMWIILRLKNKRFHFIGMEEWDMAKEISHLW